jgi:sugar O-acyltransferase (sialic acid O-acetyltransferase NeuD family)
MILVGGGGHALSVIDVVEAWGQEPIDGVVDPSAKCPAVISGWTYLGTDADLVQLRSVYRKALVTIGQVREPSQRRSLFRTLLGLGFEIPHVISPFARVSPQGQIEEGTLVGHGASVGPYVSVGANCIINTGAILEHGSRVAGHCHISTGSIVNGDVSIGEATFIGSGAIIHEGVAVGANCIIGAGATVARDCPPGSIVHGPRSSSLLRPSAESLVTGGNGS